MTNLHKEIFKDKNGHQYQISFFDEEGATLWENGKDYFKACIAVCNNDQKKEIEIKVSHTLLNGIWKISNDGVRDVVHKIGLKKIKLQINKIGFESLANIQISQDATATHTLDEFLTQLDKELIESQKKQIGF